MKVSGCIRNRYFTKKSVYFQKLLSGFLQKLCTTKRLTLKHDFEALSIELGFVRYLVKKYKIAPLLLP